jgi:hypothetical protein
MKNRFLWFGLSAVFFFLSLSTHRGSSKTALAVPNSTSVVPSNPRPPDFRGPPEGRVWIVSAHPSPQPPLHNNEPIEISVTVRYALRSVRQASLGIYATQVPDEQGCHNPSATSAPLGVGRAKKLFRGSSVQVGPDGEGEQSAVLKLVPLLPPRPGFVHVWARIWFIENGETVQFQSPSDTPCYAIAP